MHKIRVMPRTDVKTARGKGSDGNKLRCSASRKSFLASAGVAGEHILLLCPRDFDLVLLTRPLCRDNIARGTVMGQVCLKDFPARDRDDATQDEMQLLCHFVSSLS